MARVTHSGRSIRPKQNNAEIMAALQATPAAAKAFGTAEILETILLEVGDIKTVWASERVNKMFKGTIAGSVKLQRALWILPVLPVIPKIDDEEILPTTPLGRGGRHASYEKRIDNNSYAWFDKSKQHLETAELNPLSCNGGPWLGFSSSIEPFYSPQGLIVFAEADLSAFRKYPRGSWRKMHIVRSTKPTIELSFGWRDSELGERELLPKYCLDFQGTHKITLGELVDDLKEMVMETWCAWYDHGL